MKINARDKKSSSILDGEERSANYVVGIDLGTTNCAVCFVDLRSLNEGGDGTPIVETFLIPQGVAPNVVEERTTLPSFFARIPNAPATPWEEKDERRKDFSAKRKGSGSRDGKYGAVGIIARDYGASETDSFVCSAKSWLCHSGVDRTGAILPWSSRSILSENEEGASRRWSPVEISSYYLAHIRNAWNARFPDDPLEAQDVVLTIPASFDEIARTLTLEAAKMAGIPRATLVEEPQAAFYAQLARREKDWARDVRPGDKILVCDVGGGTTDFALIYAIERDREENAEDARPDPSKIRFYRVAVGDHLILGGDNLDLALYCYLEEKIRAKRPKELNARERSILLKECREAKEFFLSANVSSERRRFVLPGSGSSLIGGSLAIDVERSEIEELLVDGFFPRVPFDANPTRKRAGLREIGLPYAADSAVTKYLARFLNAHRNAGADLRRAGAFGDSKEENAKIEQGVDPARPDVVLFNGGAFESPRLRERIVESLVDWFDGERREWRPVVLENQDLYLAVARGAAYYGLALRGAGTRIGASLARSYYVGVALDSAESANGTKKAPKAVCLLPAQCEAGDEIVLPKTFELAVDRPVSFPIFVSSSRTLDAPGDLIEVDPNETRELSPIHTALKTRSQSKLNAGSIRAQLVARPTEIGTIELFLREVLPENAPSRARASRWTLQFDARGGTQSDWEATANEGEQEGIVDESLVERARVVLKGVFARDDELGEVERIKPGELFRRVGTALETDKDAIPLASLRRLAETTLELADGRKRSAAVEARWLNWLGFALRPGFGAATDDWRVDRAWKTIGGRLAFNAPETRAQYWILWRRVASGLSGSRQLALAEPTLASLRALRRQLVEGRGKGSDLDLTSQEGAELWRALGSFELLPLEIKEEIGSILLDVMPKKKLRPIRSALVWALGRLGARVMFNAPLDRVVASNVAQEWTSRLLDDLRRDGAGEPTPTDLFALAQLARSAEDPAFDVDLSTRESVAAYLLRYNAEESTLAALEKHGRIVDESTRQIFGEALPLGLRWN